MKTSKDKAQKLFDVMMGFHPLSYRLNFPSLSIENAKQCALIAVENEYKTLREQLFNLKEYRVIESEEAYLYMVEMLIIEEQEVKQEILSI